MLNSELIVDEGPCVEYAKWKCRIWVLAAIRRMYASGSEDLATLKRRPIYTKCSIAGGIRLSIITTPRMRWLWVALQRYLPKWSQGWFILGHLVSWSMGYYVWQTRTWRWQLLRWQAQSHATSLLVPLKSTLELHSVWRNSVKRRDTRFNRPGYYP